MSAQDEHSDPRDAGATESHEAENQPEPEPDTDTVRSLARLAVGLGLMGTEQLISALRKWEGEVTAGRPEEGAAASPSPDLGSAVLGSMFDLGRRVREGLPRAAATGARGARGTWLMVNLVGLSGIVRFAGQRLEPARRAVADEFERLATLGHEEEARARLLVETAFREGVADATAELGGRAIEAITQSPKVREMIRTESAGVTEEALDGMRRRTANVDDLLDRRTRSMFRRTHSRTAGPSASGPPPDQPALPSTPDPDGASV